MTTLKTTHQEEMLGLLLEQFKRSDNLIAWLTAYMSSVQDLENVLNDLTILRQIDYAEGTQLETLGTIVGVTRQGRTDEAFRVWIRVRIRLNYSSGLDSDLVDTFTLLLGEDPPIEIQEAYPAAFAIYIKEFIDADANTLASVVSDARAAAVSASLWYLTTPVAESFTFSTGSDSPDQGFGSAWDPGGGHLAGVIQA